MVYKVDCNISIKTMNTDMFIPKESFDTPQECLEYEQGMKDVTNRLYPRSFRQLHFTVGDADQFLYAVMRVDMREPRMVTSEGSSQKPVWSRFSITNESVDNTFNYLFHKFKKGTFLRVYKNRVHTMLPFSKAKYTNDWSGRIGYDSNKYSSMDEVLALAGTTKNVNRDRSQWYANNGIVRNEFPVRERDSAVAIVADMFRSLCKRYDDVPNIEVFINRRDHPLLTRDGYEPYDCIYGASTPLVSHRYETYAPVLSMCTKAGFADILIPTWDDWARVCAFRKKSTYFSRCRHYDQARKWKLNRPWHTRVESAVFRGTSTGYGVTLDTNMRLRIASMATENVVENGVPLLNAGITSWNTRPRILSETGYIDTIDPSIIESVPVVECLTFEEQTAYKYTICIDGHVFAFRLAMLLGMGSVVLLVESEYQIWFSKWLQPFVHYIPVQRDLSDLYDRIRWCRSHDATCARIAARAHQFYQTYLSEEGVLAYLRSTLFQIRAACSLDVRPHRYIHYVYDRQVRLLQSYTCLSDKKPAPAAKRRADFIPRSYGWLRGIQMYVDEVGSFPSKFEVRDIPANNPVEYANELVMGVECVNRILRYVPNFTYTYFVRNGTDIRGYVEKVPVYYTLRTFLRDRYSSPALSRILVQVILALHAGYDLCLFRHRNLTLSNIRIYQHRDEQAVACVNVTGYPRYTTLKSTHIPYIFDYTYASGFVRGEYGTSTIQNKQPLVHELLQLIVRCAIEISYHNPLPRFSRAALVEFSKNISHDQRGCRYPNVQGIRRYLYKILEEMDARDTPSLKELTVSDLIAIVQDTFGQCVQTRVPFVIERPMRFAPAETVAQFLLSSAEKMDTFFAAIPIVKRWSVPRSSVLSFASSIDVSKYLSTDIFRLRSKTLCSNLAPLPTSDTFGQKAYNRTELKYLVLDFRNACLNNGMAFMKEAEMHALVDTTVGDDRWKRVSKRRAMRHLEEWRARYNRTESPSTRDSKSRLLERDGKV